METTSRETLEEKGAIASSLRRAGNRVKNTAKTLVGGDWSKMGNEGHGQLDVADLAALLRKGWYRFAGQQKGHASTVPTPNNVIAWANRTHNINLPVNPDDDADAAGVRAGPASSQNPDDGLAAAGAAGGSMSSPAAAPKADAPAPEAGENPDDVLNPAAAPAAAAAGAAAPAAAAAGAGAAAPAAAAPAAAAPAAAAPAAGSAGFDVLYQKVRDATVTQADIQAAATAAGIAAWAVEKAVADNTANNASELETDARAHAKGETTAAAPAAPAAPAADGSPVEKLTSYMLSGNAFDNFKPKPEALAANGRDPEEHLALLRRFLQAGAGPNTVDPTTGKKPIPPQSPMGAAMAKLTTALEKGNSGAVDIALAELKKLQAQSSNPMLEDYLKGVMADHIYKQKFPNLAGNFTRMFSRAVSAIQQQKEAKGKPTPAQTEEFIQGMVALLKRGANGDPEDKQRLRGLFEPLQSDSVILTRFPTVQKVLDKAKEMNLIEGLDPSGYVGHLFESNGFAHLLEDAMPGVGEDDEMDRVELDKYFEKIAQAMYRHGMVSFGGDDHSGGGGAVSGSGQHSAGGGAAGTRMAGGALRFRIVDFRDAMEEIGIKKSQAEKIIQAMKQGEDIGEVVDSVITQKEKHSLVISAFQRALSQ